MVELLINKKKYKGIEKWSEMDSSFASKLYSISIPEKLKQYYKVTIDDDDEKTNKFLLTINEEDLIKIFPTYYGEVIQFMFSIPSEVMEKIKPNDRTWVFDTFCRTFILGVHFVPNMVKSDFEYIQCGDEKLYPPESKYVLGQEVPMYEESAMSFAESADLQLNSDKFTGGMFEVAPNLISILCRPKGEKYNEKKSLERAEKLKDVKMDVVWDVFFCLVEYLAMQNLQDLQSFLKQAELKRNWRQRLRDYLRWDGTVQYWTYLKTTRALNMSKK